MISDRILYLEQQAARRRLDRLMGFGVAASRFSSDRTSQALVLDPARLPIDTTEDAVDVQDASGNNLFLDDYSDPSGPDI